MKLAEYHKTKPSKYRNKRTVVDGIAFASRREAKRYGELQLLAKFGDVRDLRLQVSYDLHAAGGERVARYVADFVYRDREGTEVVEDAKGVKTPVYALKRRWMRAEYGIEIVEV